MEQPTARPFTLGRSRIQILQIATCICFLLSAVALLSFPKYVWVMILAYPFSLALTVLTLWFRRSTVTLVTFMAHMALPLVVGALFMMVRTHEKLKQPVPSWSMPMSHVVPGSLNSSSPSS
ncbi:MAG: hypothetical protein PHD76_01625 [Methylacidiphilales bacterium]|nr:hypothetical protein [Candidatus Methylacidiphilales bacterium]